MARKLTSEDLYGLTFVSSPQLSPDGTRAVCVVTSIDPGPAPMAAAATGAKASARKGTEAAAAPTPYTPPRYRSRIHLFDLPPRGAQAAKAVEGDAAAGRTWTKVVGNGGREFTRGEYRDFAPRFSPDGTMLAFLAVRAEKSPPQLYVMPLAGGEALKVSDMKSGVYGYEWLPDSRSLVFVSRGSWTDQVGERALPRRITRQRHRGDGEGFLSTEPSNVYRVGVDGGDAQRLTDNQEGVGSLAVSADGKTLYFTRAKNVDDDTVFKADIVAFDLGTRKETVLAASVGGPRGLAPSPDGTTLAYLASSRQNQVESPTGVWLIDLGGRTGARTPRLISGDTDVGPAVAGDSRHGAYATNPAWVTEDWLSGTASSDAPALLVATHEAGGSATALLHLDGTYVPLQGQGAVTAFSTSRGAPGRLLFTAESPTRPGELWLKDGAGREVRLSAANDAWCKAVTLVAPDGPFALPAKRSKRAKGTTSDEVGGRESVQYWTISPAKPRADKASVVQVHGGPHTAYGHGFVFEFQLLASNGYGVIYGNPRGSSSYGYDFAAAVLGRYGTIDAEDVMDIAEAGSARLGGAKAPLHLTGGSYGGFMTNWLIGTTNRFTSAVSQRSISNWTSMYGSSDIGPVFVEREIGGNPWDDLDTLWRQSPIRNVKAVKTPLLLIHSENDFRCPIDQAEQFYTAIKRLGTSEVELLRVPDEGHELSRSGRPDRRVARLDAIVEWFVRHS